MLMNYFLTSLALSLILLPASSYANAYDVNYFKKNPDDIGEQLDICRIQVWNAKLNCIVHHMQNCNDKFEYSIETMLPQFVSKRD